MTEEQKAILLLWQRVNTSLSAYYKLIKAFATAQVALQKSGTQWSALGIHQKHVTRHNTVIAEEDTAFIHGLEQRIAHGEFNILFTADDAYPKQLKQLFDPPPVLFYRGDKARLSQAQIAMVGSRKPSPSAQKFTFDMAQYLAQSGYVIVSGLAQGVDAQAHLGALAQSNDSLGRTVGVMGTGIDVSYPKPHTALINRIVSEGGCVISELLPNTQPNKFTFPRRNRIVAGLGLGTIVTEAALKSGSLITARLTSEQGKQVFALPSSIDNSNAEGCHHLIREGATLIYHPDQVIEDLNQQLTAPTILPTQTKPQETLPTAYLAEPTPTQIDSTASLSDLKPTVTKNTVKKSAQNISQTKPSVPDYLQTLWVHIDWEGQDLDVLVDKTNLDTPVLLGQLMELELMGLIVQTAGRYKRL